MPNAPNRLYLNAVMGPLILRSGGQEVACRRVKAILLIRDPRLRSMTVRTGPRSPSTTMPTDAGDAVMVEEKISLKFAQVGHRQPAAGDTSEQGPEHSLPRISHGGKCDVPQICFRIEQ